MIWENPSSLDSTLGSLEVYPGWTEQFLQWWFDPDDTFSLSGMPPSGRVYSTKYKVRNFVRALSEEALLGLCFVDGDVWDLYYTIAPVLEGSGRIGGRVRESEVSAVRGVTVDLDVKEGAFSSAEDALSFARSLPVIPGAAVQTGTGGLHLYWKFSDPGDVPVEVGKAAIRDWWTLVSEWADAWRSGIVVDRLVDVPRMLRLPGASRLVGGRLEPVRLLWCGGDGVPAASVLGWSAGAAARRAAHVRGVQDRERALFDAAADALIPSGGGAWNDLLWAGGGLEEWVNSSLSWSDVLGEAGWSLGGIDDEGRQTWARPGRAAGERSAVVGWEGGDAMALFSTASETGLADLLEAGIPLTKYRVWLRIAWNDDLSKAMEYAKISSGAGL